MPKPFQKIWAFLLRRRRERTVSSGYTDSLPGPAPASGDEVSEFVKAVNVSKNIAVATRIIWAGTSETRRKGLLGRDAISRDEGMYIVPTQWIHMFGMRFPIDVAFLAADGKVLHVHHRLKPNRLSKPVLRAEGALELAAGVLQQTNTEVGDIIQFE